MVHGRRIALVQAGLSSGGAEKILGLLATHLDAQGHRITMLAIVGTPEDGYYSLPPGVAVRTMEAELGPGATGSTRARIAWLRRTLRETETELVISFLTKINVQVAVACLGLGIRRIASERNNFLMQGMNPLWRVSMPLALFTADRVVMLTKASRAALPAWARRRAEVIYNPAPAAEGPPAEDPPPRRLVAVGRLTAQKGFDILIQAVYLARARGCDMSLTIFGEGEDRDALSRLVHSLGLSDHVRFAGRTKHPHEWTRLGGIFVFSSRYEGFGNVLIEAMAAGFAVVSTACDWGPPEMVTDGLNGLLVPPEDPDGLADALVRVWEDDALRARLAKEAVRRAADFPLGGILSQWDSVIGAALERRHGATPRGGADAIPP